MACLQNGENILLDRELPENRGFLRQISHSQACAAVHRQAGNVALLESYGSFIRPNYTNDHIEGSGFSCAIRPEQADDFASGNLDGNSVYDPALTVFLNQLLSGQQSVVGSGLER